MWPPSLSLWLRAMRELLESRDIAYDIGAYRDAPAGLRIWCGPTVNTEDVRHLTQWLAWAYSQVE